MLWGARRLTWLWTALGIYLLLLAALFTFQRSLLYLPSSDRPDPARTGLSRLESITVTSPDGLPLESWYLPPLSQAAPVVVVFHGNAGHIGHRIAKYHFLAEAGAGLLLAGYRGYGGNPGSPAEPEMTADGAALLAWLRDRGIGAERTFLYGESLGTGLANKLAAAAETPLAGVILEAPYTSIAAVAQAHYWYVPAYWLVRDRWDSEAVVAGVRAPLLVLHGERDRTVPTRFGRALFEAASEPKDALWLPAASHNDVLDHSEARQKVMSFLRLEGRS